MAIPFNFVARAVSKAYEKKWQGASGPTLPDPVTDSEPENDADDHPNMARATSSEANETHRSNPFKAVHRHPGHRVLRSQYLARRRPDQWKLDACLRDEPFPDHRGWIITSPSERYD